MDRHRSADSLTAAKEIMLEGVDVSCAVEASADYRRNYGTGIVGSNRHLCYYTQAENMIISSSVK